MSITKVVALKARLILDLTARMDARAYPIEERDRLAMFSNYPRPNYLTDACLTAARLAEKIEPGTPVDEQSARQVRIHADAIYRAVTDEIMLTARSIVRKAYALGSGCAGELGRMADGIDGIVTDEPVRYETLHAALLAMEHVVYLVREIPACDRFDKSYLTSSINFMQKMSVIYDRDNPGQEGA